MRHFAPKFCQTMPRRYFSQLCTHRRQHEKEQRVDKSGALWVLPVQKAQKTKNTHRPKPNEHDDAFNVFRRAALNTPSNIVWFVLLILIDLRAIYSPLCNFLCDSRTMFPLPLPMHISTAALQQSYTQTICLTELCAGMRGNLIFSCLLEAPAFLASKLRSFKERMNGNKINMNGFLTESIANASKYHIWHCVALPSSKTTNHSCAYKM